MSIFDEELHTITTPYTLLEITQMATLIDALAPALYKELEPGHSYLKIVAKVQSHMAEYREVAKIGLNDKLMNFIINGDVDKVATREDLLAFLQRNQSA